MAEATATRKDNMLQRAEILVVIVVWTIAFMVPVFSIDSENAGIGEELLHTAMSLLPFIVLFALNHWLLIPKLLFRGRWVSFAICNIALSLIMVLNVGYRLKNRHAPPPHEGYEMQDGRQEPRRPRRPPIEGTMLLLSIMLIGCDLGIKLGFRYLRIQQEKAQQEKQYSENKLVFLKQQVRPHFFMNTLNNIHALIDIDQELAKEAVIRLSKLMRYMLYGCESGMSKIGSEVEFITSYVELMRLRYSDKVSITTTISDTLPSEKTIPSLIFVSLIENAFKHGVSYKDSSFIRMSLKETPDGKLQFVCENSIPKQPVPKSTGPKEGGIGIQNTINQLNLIYGDAYDLAMDKNEIFTVKLTIPL